MKRLDSSKKKTKKNRNCSVSVSRDAMNGQGLSALERFSGFIHLSTLELKFRSKWSILVVTRHWKLNIEDCMFARLNCFFGNNWLTWRRINFPLKFLVFMTYFGLKTNGRRRWNTGTVSWFQSAKNQHIDNLPFPFPFAPLLSIQTLIFLFSYSLIPNLPVKSYFCSKTLGVVFYDLFHDTLNMFDVRAPVTEFFSY